jgi:PAS domain S-box-containing protein
VSLPGNKDRYPLESRDSEAELRVLAQAMPNQVWTANPAGAVEFVNERITAYTGAPEPELIGRNWARWVHLDDLPALRRRWAAALAAGTAHETEFRLRRADGVYRWHLARAVPVRDAAGRIVRWIGSNTDIDDQKTAARALGALNERLEQEIRERTSERDSAWRNAQDLLMVAATDGVLRAVNPAWTRILGWSADEVTGRNLIDLAHPDDAEDVREALAHAADDVPARFEARIRRRDRSYRRIGWLSAPEGGLVYASGRDVTREREQAAALARSEARLRAVFETSYQYQGLMTPEGILLDANPASLDGIAARLEDVVGRPFWETPWFTGTPGMAEQVQAAVPRVAAGALFRQEITLDLPTGRRVFDFSMRPVRDLAGKVIFLVPEAMEVTERRAAEERLREAQKMQALGQLTGGIAHDFNNMLTGITGAIDLIRRRVAQGRIDRLDRYIDTATAAATRAAGLTQRLLAFARRQSLEIKPQDVNALIEDMAEMLRRTLGEGIRLALPLQDGLWPALTDSNQLESAILNLAINARDAMPEGGQLVIETANSQVDRPAAAGGDLAAGDYVLVSVSDTGIGMSPDIAKQAFDPFFTTKPIGQGTGLGLSMVYGFAQQCGGQVRLESELGRGTCVRIYLPRASQGLAPSADGGVVAAPEGRGETVLVVEDDPAVRMLIGEVLGELGYRFVEAADGQAAIPHLESSRPIDLLVTDVGLPNVNGRQLAEIARRLRPALKVLFVTGYAEQAAVRAGMLPAGMEIMTKPFTLDALAGRIRRLIEG